MKISLLGSDLSGNELGRLYLLAKVLQRRYEVEIVGLSFARDEKRLIWDPVANDDLRYGPVRARRTMPWCFGAFPEVLRRLDGDVLYVEGALGSSLGLALLKKVRRRLPVVLDVGDWELGHIVSDSRLGTLRSIWARKWDINGHLPLVLMEKLARFADAVTASNSFTARRFGATLIPHARDTAAMDPARFDRRAIREEFGVAEKQVVMFLGSPKAHKGVDDLVRAVCRIRRKDITLLVVGADQRSPYVRYLQSIADERVGFIGRHPFNDVPRYISMADVMVIPQRDDPAARGQMPAKVFDAMAMAKPIVASRVGDIPTVLDGCGYLTAPGDVEELALTIQYALENEEEATHKGAKARERCIAHYSWDAIEERLAGIFEGLGG